MIERYQHVRQHSLDRIEPLSAEDCAVQSMPDASPSKWHLAHSSWFFETVLLGPHQPGYRVFDPAFAYLFNSYYDSFGERHARPARGQLSRPSLAQVLDYRRHVDRAMALLLSTSDPAIEALAEIGLQHEQQHQELLLTDILHALSCNPLQPAYDPHWQDAPPPNRTAGWMRLTAGVQELGHRGDGFAYDNETPRHSTYLPACELATDLVSNGEFQAFIDAGGYQNPAWWLSDGWAWRHSESLEHPLYWQPGTDGWSEFGLAGRRPLQADAAARHLSFYEADAYARWAGARLPTEAEWEIAAVQDLTHCFGHVWQWTASAYAPYPGYRPPAGALAEYNAKFMCNQMVLRGSSAFTPAGHSRCSYRNFFYPQSRWQCSGLRLARDLVE